MALKTFDVESLNTFLECVDLDENVKTRMICDTYTHLFERKFHEINTFRKSDISIVKRLLDLGDEIEDENLKTQMICDMYTNIFEHKFNEINIFRKSDISMVKRLLDLGADVNGGPSISPLCIATNAGSYTLVELLCQHGVDVNETCYTNMSSPLTIAAEQGRYDLIELMLKFGANVNDKSSYYSALNGALCQGHIDCAKLLVQHGAKVDIKIALHNLIRNHSILGMNFLFENYKHETHQYILKNKQSLLMSAANANVEICSCIHDVGGDITEEYLCKEVLLAASKNGDIARFLIQKGADVNKVIKTSNHNYTPLLRVLKNIYVCDSSSLEVVRVLLENGASPNIFCDDISPLMFAASNIRSVALLQLLLDHGADIKLRDKNGDTALMYSAYRGHPEQVAFLISYSKDSKHVLNAQNNEGVTALMCAVNRNNIAAVKKLINQGADMNITEKDGNTALLYALCKSPNYENPSFLDIVTSLINAGSDVNWQNNHGFSPLMLAAKATRTTTMSLLLDAGADVNAVSKTDSTKTALSCLKNNSFSKIDITVCLSYLLDRGACSSYISSENVHDIIHRHCMDILNKLIASGLGPVTVRSDYSFHDRLTGPIFNVSPLCTALLCGNISLASHFIEIMFLTKSDISSLMYNKCLRTCLEETNHRECLNLLDEMSSQPVSLFRLAFVTVLSAVGTSPGRANCVKILPLPQILKNKLLFKS